MRDPERIDRMIEKLRKLWHAMPDLRLGQLVDNLNTSLHAETFHVEDDEMEASADRWLAGKGLAP